MWPPQELQTCYAVSVNVPPRCRFPGKMCPSSAVALAPAGAPAQLPSAVAITPDRKRALVAVVALLNPARTVSPRRLSAAAPQPQRQS
jgi:hypothetical protein